jgi:hypothetical protein
MSISGKFKTNPFYVDITKLDHLSPQPTFSYQWNTASGRWEPLNFDRIHDLLGNITISGGTVSGDNSKLEAVNISGFERIAGLIENLQISGTTPAPTEPEVDTVDFFVKQLESGNSIYNIEYPKAFNFTPVVSASIEISGSSPIIPYAISGISSGSYNIAFASPLKSDQYFAHTIFGTSSLTASTGDLDAFTTQLNPGSSLYNIPYPINLSSPPALNATIEVSGGSPIIPHVISGVESDSYNIIFSSPLETSDYFVHTTFGGTASNGTSISVDIEADIPEKLRTITLNQKIEEDFILLESISSQDRYGSTQESKSIMDDVYGTYYENGRRTPGIIESAHPEYFLHEESTSTDRTVETEACFHSDCRVGLRQENASSSKINSYKLTEHENIYNKGLVDHVTIQNTSPYPIQFHTENKSIMMLHPDISVKIENDEADKIYIKRPHTISGFSVPYSITYRVTGNLEI